MKNKTIFLVIVIALVAVAGYFLMGKGGGLTALNAGNIKTFTVEGTDLLMTGKAFTKAEVWGKLAGSKTDEKIGDMTLVEGDAKGDQAWLMPLPENAKPYVEIIAKGYFEDGKEGGAMALAAKGEEGVKSALNPAAASNIGIPGTITSINAAKKTIAFSSSSYGDLTVTLSDAKTMTDSKGRATTFSALKKGQSILVIGNFTDETTFKAVEVEVTK